MGCTGRAAFQDTWTPATEKNESLSSDLDLGPSCYQSSEKNRRHFSWLSFFMSQPFVPFVNKMPLTYSSGAYREAHEHKRCKESLLPLPVCHRGTNISNKSSKSLSAYMSLELLGKNVFSFFLFFQSISEVQPAFSLMFSNECCMKARRKMHELFFS